ncbi:MAG TPA: hypothetical protein VG496_06480, partial [Myxococcales bacterium]|nr:hypothetical protein [Myxococcales bacterium]
AYALGAAPLPASHRKQWANLLRELCTAHRRAPEAARRLRLVEPWPPNLPEAFAAMVREAEQSTATVAQQGAATGEVKPPPQPASAPVPVEAPAAAARTEQTHAAGTTPVAKASLPQAPSRATLTEVGKKMAPPIRPSLFRRPTGTLTEGPVRLPSKTMPPVARPSTATSNTRVAQAGREPSSTRVRVPEPSPPPIRKARVADGPFAARVRSLFDDRPDAVERLCAAVEARAALAGLAGALEELGRELSRDRWKERRATREQLDRLAAAACSEHAAWSAAARLLMAQL